jgi:hypothetical protein
MEGELLEMQFDLKKMPLGNLTKDHIRRGYDVLSEISDILTGECDQFVWKCSNTLRDSLNHLNLLSLFWIQKIEILILLL